MKRSEMLEIIRNTIEHYHSDSDLSIQECVLTTMESFGIYPPSSKVVSKYIPMFEETEHVIEPLWEPEDETV